MKGEREAKVGNLIRTARKAINIVDFYSLAMLFIYTALAVIFYDQVENSLIYILINVAISIFIVFMAYYSDEKSDDRTVLLIRRVYIAPLVLFIYSQVHEYVPIINPRDFDWLLIQWDRALFGCDPTKLFADMYHPALTEFLQFSYITYFFMPLIHGIEWHVRRDDEKFTSFANTIIFSFYISYLLYFALPAIGPRFTLHSFASLSEEIPGLWLTEFFRYAVNTGGGIVAGASPIATVHRDCMPSGHTMMTVANIIFAFKFKSKFRWVFVLFGASLIFSTVYLRYHYVVDLIAGAAIAVLAVWLEPKIARAIKKSKIIGGGGT